MRSLPPLAAALAAALALLGCRADSANTDAENGHSVTTGYSGPVAPPLALEGKAYDTAGAGLLPAEEPEEFPGLHNVYHLSANIVSGSEPQGWQALETLRAMGVRTIVSVDGKAPDARAAAELGMRYVHVPIQYRGISDVEMARLAKTFRELEPPFYVHCFHGKHRGPAGAAVGRVVLDGADRWTAIAEMRQYCGTSAKYEGLYRAIAVGEIPAIEETARFDYAFDAAQLPAGVVGVMVELSRAHDYAVELGERDWRADPEHPDVDALNEATKLLQAYEVACELEEVRTGDAEFRSWFEASRDASRDLVDALERLSAGDASGAADADVHFAAVRQLCSDCHAVFRN
jgi:hypothetical protein